MSISRYVGEAETLPRGYGIAWYDFAARRALCLPVPLNKVAGALRRAAQWLRRPLAQAAEQRAFEAGRVHGRDVEQMHAAVTQQVALRRAYWQGRDHEHAMMEVRVRAEITHIRREWP